MVCGLRKVLKECALFKFSLNLHPSYVKEVVDHLTIADFIKASC